ncbi:MAG: hypothetical protein J1F07_02840 [Muribaculaceae bacterium]|nr:hypothetical protein [Muribaculaceae bacterium]
MKTRYILGAIVAGMVSFSSFAQQNTYSGYFLDNFLYRHQMNPAMGNTENFVGFPGLGNLSVGTQGNLHLTKIFYNYDGKTVLFTNPNITAKQVGHFASSNKLGANFRENIINVGFKALGGYNTVAISAVGNSRVSAPGSLLNLMKEGISNQTYDIRNLNLYANAYAEIALNHSRDIPMVPGLRVGATFKFLVGVGNIYGKFKRAHLSLGTDAWDIESEGDIYTSVKGMKYKMRYNETADRYYVDGFDTDNFSAPNGFGAAFDLGATYEWNDFNFSFAILDLGGIKWTQTQHASTNGLRQFQTDKYVFEINEDDDEQSTWDKMKDDLSEIYQLENNGEVSRSTMQATTMNLGVEYTLPYYRPLKFGLLNTTRMAGTYSWTEFRISANVQPVKYVSASANLVVGTYGVGFGWLLNVTSGKGFNLFIGMDRVPGKLAKQFVPLNSNLNFNFGMNFPF